MLPALPPRWVSAAGGIQLTALQWRPCFSDALTDLGPFILDGASPGLVVQPRAAGPGVGPNACYNFKRIPLFF